MDRKLSRTDINAMFECVGVSPIERDKEELRELMAKSDRHDDSRVVYRTVLSNGTGEKSSSNGGRDAKLERNSR